MIAGDNVAKQHRLLVCRMTLETKKRKITKAEPRIKWWKLKTEDCCEEFREEIRRALGGKEELRDDWTTTANVVRDTAIKVLGVSSKQRKEDKETWWWDEEVQESIRMKRLAKKRLVIERGEESKQEYKEIRRKRWRRPRARHMMRYTRSWILRKDKRHCTDWRDRDTKRERTYNRS